MAFDLSAIGGILGGGGSILSALLGRDAAGDYQDAYEDIAMANYDLQLQKLQEQRG